MKHVMFIASQFLSRCAPLCFLVVSVALAQSEEPCCQSASWNQFSRSGQCSELRQACDELLAKSPSLSAHMCMVNAELCGKNGGVRIGGRNSDGQHIMGPGFSKEEVAGATTWLEKAASRFPTSKEVPLTRLQIAGMTGDSLFASAAIEQFASANPKLLEIETWLGIFSQFFESGDFEGAIRIGKTIEKYYAENHKIHGNLGGAYAMAKQDAEAKRHLEKAVSLAPKDPINRWNLGRLYQFTGEPKLADQAYQQSIEDEANPNQKRQMRCTYADFLEKVLNDKVRSDKVRPQNCGRR